MAIWQLLVTFVNQIVCLMVDGIKIYFKKSEFTGNFDNCMEKHTVKYQKLYYLKNECGDHYMVIRFTKTNRYIISGSLRKWLLGHSAIEDLTEKTFTQALRKLAVALNMPYKDLLKGKITQCEIGMNILTHEPIENINRKILDYKGFDRKDYKHKHETVYFNGSDKRITIYDKLREIAAKVKRKDERIKIKKEFIQLFINGFHYLRLELRLFDHRSFVRHDVGYIVTLGDLQTHYHDLYRVWVKEMNNLTIFSSPVITSNIKGKAADIANDLNEIGFIETLEKYYNDIANQSKSDGAKSFDKSRTLNIIRALVDRYGSKDEYNKAQFRKDIARALVKISRCDAQINLSLLFKLLWERPRLR